MVRDTCRNNLGQLSVFPGGSRNREGVGRIGRGGVVRVSIWPLFEVSSWEDGKEKGIDIIFL